MNRPLLIGSQLVVGLNGTLIIARVCCASLEENVALPAKRLAFFGCARVTLQHLIIQGESVLWFPKLTLDHRLLIARGRAHRDSPCCSRNRFPSSVTFDSFPPRASSTQMRR